MDSRPAKDLIELKCASLRGQLDALVSETLKAEARIKGFSEASQIIGDQGGNQSISKKLEDKIRKERVALDGASEAAAKLKAELSALEETLRILEKESSDSGAPELREGSELFKVREAILACKRPMTLTELLPLIGKEDTTGAKNSLRGSISRYAREDIIFVKTAPNTFGLFELGHGKQKLDTNTTPEDLEDLEGLEGTLCAK